VMLSERVRGAMRECFRPAPIRQAVARWVVAGVCGVALWGTLFGFGHRGNLAYGMPVRTSGPCKLRPEHTWFSVHPSRLVDGKRWRPFDGCAEGPPEPWIVVGLKRPSSLSEVVVTGRRDCCWNYEDLPVILELSADNLQFREVARRDVPFSDRDPWRVELNGDEAQFVRLRVQTQQPAAIALSEIEVFGTPL
jgi:hypothetical protein